MEDQLVTLETAKLAKEKGFDIPVFFHYSENPVNDLEILCHPDDPQVGQGWILMNYNINTYIYKKYSAPTQSLLQKWLRTKYSIHIEIIWIDTLRDMYVYKILSPNNAIRPESIVYYSYEEALESGLFSALQLIT